MSRPSVGEQLVGALVVERRPLEVEEQQLRLDRGAPLLTRCISAPLAGSAVSAAKRRLA